MLSKRTELPPEIALLLCCARQHLQVADAERLEQLLAGKLDWPLILKLADKHTVTQLLYHHLADWSDHLPDEVLQQLREAYQLGAIRGSLLTAELCGLLELFASHDLPTIAYKGPALSLALYDNLLLRHFGDLDLFIRKSDLPRATELLEASGYQLALSPREQEYFLKHRYHYSFVREDGKVVVEVHWAFTRRCWPYPLGDDALFQRSGSIKFKETSIPCLSPEDNLLVLCAHGGKERWARLQLVTDVAELIRRHRIDWPWVLAESQRIGRERVLLLGVALAHSMLGAHLPEIITERIERDQTVSNLVKQLRMLFFDDNDWPLRGMHAHRFYWAVWSRPSDRTGYLREVICDIPGKFRKLATPTQTDRIGSRLPRGLNFLHYLARPFRLAYAYRNPKRLLQRLSRFF